jgi:hypothetical protein
MFETGLWRIAPPKMITFISKQFHVVMVVWFVSIPTSCIFTRGIRWKLLKLVTFTTNFISNLERVWILAVMLLFWKKPSDQWWWVPDCAFMLIVQWGTRLRGTPASLLTTGALPSWTSWSAYFSSPSVWTCLRYRVFHNQVPSDQYYIY